MKRQIDPLPNIPLLKGNILVINEKTNKSCFLSDILTPKGYNVQQFTTGKEALEVIPQQLPDLLLIGIRISDISGFDICQKLKSDDHTRDIPIIFISVFGEIEDKEKAFAVGGFDCISIPFHSEELLARVKHCLTIKQMQQQCEEVISERTAELVHSTSSLEESNIALKVLLEQRDKDKKELKKNILYNIKKLVTPSLKNLRRITSDKNQKVYLETIESNLSQIASPFAPKVTDNLSKLTPAQTQIANLIQQGKTTKEIADLLNLSPATIANQRQRIRKSLALTNKKINLRTTLLSNE